MPKKNRVAVIVDVSLERLAALQIMAGARYQDDKTAKLLQKAIEVGVEVLENEKALLIHCESKADGDRLSGFFNTILLERGSPELSAAIPVDAANNNDLKKLAKEQAEHYLYHPPSPKG